jgi:Protein of unknown function (DUF1822)
MTDKLNLIRELAIPFPIPASFHSQARAFAGQYFNQNVRERVYLNTLAVLVANAYFRLLGFETNLTEPDRWNALQRLWSEANDLELTGLGNLECQAIEAGQQTVMLSAESSSDPIGCLFVEIDRANHSALLIGFVPNVITELEVAISDLQSMDDLIDYLSRLKTSLSIEISQEIDINREFAEKKTIYLRDWLNNIYTVDWEPALRGLQAVTCKKKLQLAGQIFEIQLSVDRHNDESVLVRVIVRGEGFILPRGMQVSVPDEFDIYTETVKDAADLIDIPLELSSGEEFWVELRLFESVIREYFVA